MARESHGDSSPLASAELTLALRQLHDEEEYLRREWERLRTEAERGLVDGATRTRFRKRLQQHRTRLRLCENREFRRPPPIRASRLGTSEQ